MGISRIRKVKEKGGNVCGKVVRKNQIHKGDFMIDFIYHVNEKAYKGIVTFYPSEIHNVSLDDCIIVYYELNNPSFAIGVKDSLNKCACK